MDRLAFGTPFGHLATDQRVIDDMRETDNGGSHPTVLTYLEGQPLAHLLGGSIDVRSVEAMSRAGGSVNKPGDAVACCRLEDTLGAQHVGRERLENLFLRDLRIPLGSKVKDDRRPNAVENPVELQIRPDVRN